MRLRDIASSFCNPVPLDGADTFDLLDIAASALASTLSLAAARGLQAEEVPALLHEIADTVEASAGTETDMLAVHYLAARLRDIANDLLD